ncbi:MAG: response regulator [Oscillospiraceae bacterium]|nr:response regulator [Oscillospiraceae bacterium]
MKKVKAKAKILIVDDVEINRVVLEEILQDTYEIDIAESGKEAIAKLYAYEKPPQLVLLDVLMPEMDGYELNRIMKADPNLKKVPVIFCTATTDERAGLVAGAVDFITKPFNDAEIVRLRVANHIELALYRESLEDLVNEKSKQILEAKEHFLHTMADLIEYRSLESGLHVTRTKELSRLLINRLLKVGKYADQLITEGYESMIKAVPLHDVGKVAIPDSILLKPGRLTPEEFKVIETHSTVGGQVIKALMQKDTDEYLKHCYDICMHHHERWDGTGYPSKLAGEDIPLSARIVAVVDVYDALVSKRCYKQKMPHEEAAKIICESAGTHFDPVLAEVFNEIENDFFKLAMSLQGDEE